MGGMTRQAIEAARAAGYEVDEKSGTFKKMQQQTVPTQTSTRKPGGLAAMREMTHAARTGRMSTQPKSSQDPISAAAYRYIDNLYPYGYSDNPDGIDTMWGATKKFFKGFFGRSERKKAVDEFVELDLNDPAQRKRAEELRNNLLISGLMI